MHRITGCGYGTVDEKSVGNKGPFEMREWSKEKMLIGARTMNSFSGATDWIGSKSNHGILECKCMKRGDKVLGLMGWEHHGNSPNISGLVVISEKKHQWRRE